MTKKDVLESLLSAAAAKEENKEAPGWLTKWGEDMMTHGTATGYLSDKLLDTALGVGATIVGLVVYDKYIK